MISGVLPSSSAVSLPSSIMSRLQLLYACLVGVTLFSTSLGEVDDDGSLTVTSTSASFRGKRIGVNPYLIPDYHGSVAAFTRIPYAEPPVGELRFQAPVPKVIEGDFDATRKAVACTQMTSPAFDIGMEMSEDCLYLDVFVPEPKPESAAVMVWIHGGGYFSGAGSIPKSLPVPLVAMNNVIVVTLNYRLGVLGFIGPGGEDTPFNIGLLDQRQALVWVQENIQAFGGDPSRVTIFGESAGSFSVNAHVISPMSKGLFSGAILQSGTATNQWGFKLADVGSQIAFKFGAAMNCTATTNEELVSCLRQKPADDFNTFFMENPEAAYEYQVAPTTDGGFIPRPPKQMSAEGDVNEASILVGCLEKEGNMFIIPGLLGYESMEKPSFNKTMFDFMLSMSSFNMDQVALDTAALVYMAPEQIGQSDFDYADVFANIMGDWMFFCPTFTVSEDLSAAGNPVYTYLMTHEPAISFWGKNLTWLGATHAEDIPFVFGSPFMLEEDNPDEDSLMIGSFNEEEVEMSKQIMKYWTNFAKTGNPNLSLKDDDTSQDSPFPEWPLFTKDSPTYKDLSLTFKNLEGHPSPSRCRFLQEIMPKIQENAAEMARLKSLLEEKVNADSGKSCEDPESCPEQ